MKASSVATLSDLRAHLHVAGPQEDCLTSGPHFHNPPPPCHRSPFRKWIERPTRAQLDIFSDLVPAECGLEAQTESLHHWNHVSLRPQDRFTEVVAL